MNAAYERGTSTDEHRSHCVKRTHIKLVFQGRFDNSFCLLYFSWLICPNCPTYTVSQK